MKISRLHIARISALRRTEFHKNRKDPIREIQWFPNLGHNLCENDKQTLHGLYLINYEIHLFILSIVITDGSLQVSKTALGPCKCARFRAKQTYRNYSFRYLLTFVSV